MARPGLLAVLLAGWGAPASALELVLSPGFAAVEVEAGGVGRVPFSVTNLEAKPVEISSYTWDWWYTPTNSSVLTPAGLHERSAATWIEVFPKAATIEPGETTTLFFVVSAPADADGGYYGVVFAQEEVPPTEGVAAVTTGRLGLKVAVTVKGTAKPGVDIREVSVTPPTPATPLVVTFRLENTGNVHARPTVKAIVRDVATGSIVARLAEKASPLLLPGQSGRMDATWAGDLAPGKYEVVGALGFGTDQTVIVQHPFVIDAAEASAPPPGGPAAGEGAEGRPAQE